MLFFGITNLQMLKKGDDQAIQESFTKQKVMKILQVIKFLNEF